jgi:hypothetical protein
VELREEDKVEDEEGGGEGDRSFVVARHHYFV